MRILIVKLSSLGDVVHCMPAVQDLRRSLPGVTIDWVVERGFAPLVERCVGIQAVIPCELRRWRKAPLSAPTRAQWRAFKTELQSRAYDAVIDLQGLTKSALVARLARLAPGGRRIALGNRTEGSSWEAPTRWVAHTAVRITPHVHAVERSRLLCAQAMGYALPAQQVFGLRASQAAAAGGAEPLAVAGGSAQAGPPAAGAATAPPDCIAFVHGTSRDDKCWPEALWLALGRRLLDAGWRIALPHGSDAEQQRSERLAAALGEGASVWPRLALGDLADRLAACAGVIGVDSGLSHIAVALDLPHVQIYNFDTAWRTGPQGSGRQCSVFAHPAPGVEAVWEAWQSVAPPVAPARSAA